MAEINIDLKEYRLLLSIAFSTKNYFELKEENNEISDELSGYVKDRLKDRLEQFTNNNLKK